MTAFQTVKDEETSQDKTLEKSLFGALLQSIIRSCQRAFCVLKISPNHKKREHRTVGPPTHSLREGRANSAGVTPSCPDSIPGGVTFTICKHAWKNVEGFESDTKFPPLSSPATTEWKNTESLSCQWLKSVIAVYVMQSCVEVPMQSHQEATQNLVMGFCLVTWGVDMPSYFPSGYSLLQEL